MKRSATGVVCLLAAWTGVSSTPVHGDPRREAESHLGDAMRDAVRDAIRGAVSKVVAHKVHHDSDSDPMPPPHVEHEPHAFTQRTSLRGRVSTQAQQQNPWEPVKPLRIMDHDFTPTAPMNKIEAGIEAQRGGLLPPGYYPRVVYYNKDADRPNPFPQTYNPPVPEPPENFLICRTSPNHWTDKKGIGCEYYRTALWCTEDGRPGLKWKASWGNLSAFAKRGVGAAEACCECGGGARTTVIGQSKEKRLDERRLLAPYDRVPDPKARWFERNNGHFTVPERPLRPLQAPEDYVPMPIKGVAPLDKVSMEYSRYFRALHNQKQKKQPRGLSVRYYNVPPKNCNGAQVMASGLDLTLDYGDTAYDAASLLGVNVSTDYSPVGLDAKSLQWPGKKTPVGGVFWAKWSGTVDILDAGKYSFNLDIGFNTNSELKIDGVKILSAGQCRSSKDKKICASKGCKWNKETGACSPPKPKEPLASGPAAGAVCKKGTYRTSAVLFGCQAQNGEVEVQIGPSGATTVLTVPAGVKNFNIAVESNKDLDLQIKDNSTQDFIVKFDNGIVNNQQLQGTYHGMAVTWSGDGASHESAVLSGVTTAPIVVSLMSYSASPAKVKLIYGHDGLNPCPGKGKFAGCEKFSAAAGQKELVKWSQNLVGRYQMCAHAWNAVTNAYPGGYVSWTQWESVWAMAFGENSAHGDGYKIGFALLDGSHDGYIDAAEFMKGCSMGVGAPSPAPAPTAEKSGSGGTRWADMDTCLEIRVIDKGSWPKDAFKDSGYKDDPALEQLIGSPQRVMKATKKGVLVTSPDGESEWFYPKGTYRCFEVTSGGVPPRAPSPMVSTRGPAPSIVNVEPIVVTRSAQPLPTIVSSLQEQEDDSEDDGSAMYLGAGGHCIEAMVMVTPSARNLKLMYSGPDTRGDEVVVPGQVLNCDPIVPACAEPLRQACLNYRPQCAPSAAPAPAASGPAAA